MQNSNNDNAYRKLILDLCYVVFYIPNCGILRCGKLINNVAPANYVIGSGGSDGIQENFLNKVFIHNARDEDDIIEVINFIYALGLTPIVHANYKIAERHNLHIYNENKIYNGNKNVFIISSRDVHKLHDLFKIILKSQNNFPDMVHNINESEAALLRLVEYNLKSKPLKHKIYDAMLYAEQWSLLSFEEKILRCFFSVFSLAVPVILPILLLSYYGHVILRERAYSVNLLPWQYRVYKNVHASYYDIMMKGPNKKRQEILLNIITEAQKRGFIEHQGNCIQPTALGKKVSTKHNLLLIAHSQELSKKQLMMRITTFSALILVFLISVVSSTCYLLKAEKVALYCAILSYFVVLLEGSYLVSLQTKGSRICATFFILFAGLLLLINISALYYNVQLGFEPVISGGMALITGVMLCVALLCNLYYKKDRVLSSNLFGISTTAYLSMKDYVRLFDEVKCVEVGGYNYQVFDDLEAALVGAYNAGLFGELLDNNNQDNASELHNVDRKNFSILENHMDDNHPIPSTSIADFQISENCIQDLKC